VLPAGCDRILCVRPEETLAGGDRVKPGEEAPPASPRKATRTDREGKRRPSLNIFRSRLSLNLYNNFLELE
jgi:hypothetical protein